MSEQRKEAITRTTIKWEAFPEDQRFALRASRTFKRIEKMLSTVAKLPQDAENRFPADEAKVKAGFKVLRTMVDKAEKETLKNLTRDVTGRPKSEALKALF